MTHRRPRAPPPAGDARRGRAPRARTRRRGGRARAAPQRRREPEGLGADGRRPHPEAHRRARAARRHGRAGRRPPVGQRLAEPLLPVGARGARGLGRDGDQPARRRARRAGARSADGLGVVPLQHPTRIVEYLDDAVLGRGLAGVEISSFAGDVELSDERLEPFWARAAELGCIVFLHPFGCSLDERLDRFYLSNTVGQPTENAVALSHLIFAGVLDRHPGLKVVAAHGGGYLPVRDRALRPRLGRAARGAALRARAVDLSAQALVRHGRARPERTLRHLVEVAGADRVLLGSDFPFDMGLDDPVAFVREAGLRRRSRDAILGGNAEALVETPGARMRIARWAAAGAEVGEGFVIDDRVVPFPDGLTVADVLARGLDAAHDAAIGPQVDAARRTAASPRRRPAARAARAGRDPRLRRVRGARRGRQRRRSTARARSCRSGTRRRRSTSPTRTRSSARASRCRPPVTERLDFELEVAVVIGGVAGSDGRESDAGCRGIPHLRLHDHERLVGARPPGPRDEGAPRPGEGQGLRHDPRPLDRHGRRARSRSSTPTASSPSAPRCS